MRDVSRKTKIICTMGPNSENIEILKALAEHMDVARFNFSHGTHDSHKKMLYNLREVCKEINRPVAALIDTKGPEIRTGLNEGNKKIELADGDKVILTNTLCESNNEKIYVDYKALYRELKIGNSILIDDGLIGLEVIDIKNEEVVCIVKNGGQLGEKKGVNIPNVNVNLPDITEKDEEDIKFAVHEEFDIIACSFVRNAGCIKKVKDIINKENGDMLVIAKIENKEGIENIDAIIEEADGIMVARGDLGVEIKESEVPYYQKEIIRKCNEAGKLVITATQMLDSMTHNIRPTRAEVTDVANAIYDGTDCIMLSGETANGKYPVESLLTMDEIARDTESHMLFKDLSNVNNLSERANTITTRVCKEATYTAIKLQAKYMICPTLTGHTAHMISMMKPTMPVIAISGNEKIVRQLMIYYAVHPYLDEMAEDTDLIIGKSFSVLRRYDLIEKNDKLVFVFGKYNKYNKKQHTNIIRVEEVE